MAQTIKLKRSATQGAVPSTSALALGEIAINTYDGKLFIKKNDGSEAIVTIGSLENNAVTSAKIAANAVTSSEVAANAIGSSEIAANSVGISELNVSDGSNGQVLTTDGSGNLSFSAKTSTAQSFYLNTATGDGNTTGFTLSTTPASESYIIAFIDGVFQNQDSYTFSGTTLTFDTAPPNGSTVTVYVVGSIYSGNSVVLDTFSGDDLETAFTLSENPQSENNTQVYIDGVYQQKSEYSVSGQTLTFSSPPPTGTSNIEVIAFTSTNFSVLNANSVTSASIASGAVNTSDIADNAITSAKIASGVIVASDVADNAVTSAKIAANSVGVSELNLSEGSVGQVLTTDGAGTITFEDVLVKSDAVNQTGSDIAKGTPVYQVGSSGNAISVAPADADDSNKMPAIGVTLDALTASGGTGEVAHIGFVKGINTSTYTAGDTLYISTSGGFTTTAPTGETALLQNMARVIKVDASNGSIVVMGAGRTNAVPNLDQDQFFLGNASNQAVATDFSDAVEALSINNVVEDTTPQLGGDLASNGNDILFADSDKAIFGAGSDLQIYHDGSNSYITDSGTGDLKIQGANVRLENPSGVRYFQGSNGISYLYNVGDIKLNTTSTGIDVTGEVLADSLDIDGNGDISGNLTLGGYLAGPSTFTIDPAAVGDNTGTVVIAGNLQVDGTTTTINSTTLTVDDKLVTLASGSINAAAADGAGIEVEISGATNPSLTYDGTNDEWDFNKDINVTGAITASGEITANGGIALGDSDQATFGDSDDLLIYHDGSNSYVRDTGTGDLRIQATNLRIEATSGEDYLYCASDGAVTVYYDNAAKLATTSSGIDVTGTVTGDGLVIDGDTINFNTSAGDLDIQALGGSSNQIEGSGSIKIKAAGGSVDLLNGTTEVLSTTATGINVTGTTVTDALTINTSASQTVQWNDNISVLSYYVGSASITASTTTDIVTFNGGANHYAAYDLTIYSNDSSAPSGLELTRMTVLVQTSSTAVTRSAMTIVDQTSTYATGTGNLAFSVSASGADLILTVTESDGDARNLRVFVNSEFYSANRYGGATII